MKRVLAAPVGHTLSNAAYGKSYNLLNNIKDDRFTVDAYVNNVQTPIESSTVRVHELKQRTHLRYFLAAFRKAAEELRSGSVDLYHHMNLSYRWFNPVLLAGLEGETSVVIGPSQTGHAVMDEEFQIVLENIVGIDVPQSISKKLHRLVSASRDTVVDPLRLWLFARTLRKADRIVVVHEEAKEQYANFVDESALEVIPLGVDARDFEFVERTRTKEFVAIGALRERKGYDILFESFSTVIDVHGDAHLHVFGEGPLEEELRSKASNLGIAESVTFHGYVDQSVVKDHLTKARAFIHPSRSESFSLVRLEAMAVGCPVIVSNISGAREMVRDGKEGFVVAKESTDELADAMLTVLSDFELARRLGRNARDRVEKRYDWRTIGQQYADVYANLM